MATLKDISKIDGLTKINASRYDPEDEEHFVVTAEVAPHANHTVGTVVVFYLLKGNPYKLDATIIGRMEAHPDKPSMLLYKGTELTGGEVVGHSIHIKEGARIILSS